MEILLLEDNEIDAITFQRALSKTGKDISLVQKENGEEALNYLNECEKLPNIIILDLNMPNMGGVEFLMEIKKSDRLNYIPALVFTTSDHNKDKRETFRLGVSGYFVKPLSLKAYEELLNTITNYWENSKIPE